jgi:protein-disulfide isomerase
MLKKFTAFLFVITLILAVLVGILWLKVTDLEKSGTGGTKASAEPLSVDNLKKYAKDLKLKTKDFNNCLDQAKFEEKVKDELKEGEGLGVTGTPAFFVNGYLLGGAYPYESFQAVIDFLLNNGDWKKPTAGVKELVDKNLDNGEIETTKKEVSSGNAPKQGNDNSPITMVEYSDFQCPYCANFHIQTYPKILENYIKTGKVLFVYKEYPLTFHPYAQKAAEASLCAAEQGKFWEYHDRLFTEVSQASQ